MTKFLSNYFSLNRRYSRSINIERDLERSEALAGYIMTERSLDALHRILTGFANPETNRAWTLTGVYGTGKSSFAQFLISACANQDNLMRQQALALLKSTLESDSQEYVALSEMIPEQGFFRAVVTAQREPLSHTIVRALHRGAEVFWHDTAQSKKSKIARELVDLKAEIDAGKTIKSRAIPRLVQEVAQVAKTPVLLVVDELGKNLEFVAQNQGQEDLYLLQQLAELPRESNSQVYLIGLLHQSFADYGERLSSVQRNEWAKIQGRFEDIPFKDSAPQMMRLMGKAIERSGAEKFACAIANQAEEWFDLLPKELTADISPEVVNSTYPLHPVAALVLPELCTQYAQNDRSLFTFLTSAEPYSFNRYLEETQVEGMELPTLKLDRVYDYFIEAVGMGITSRPKLQRWIEVQGLINDVAKTLDADSLRVLKTIGTLNIVTTTGALKATRSLVSLALSNSFEEAENWQRAIDNLLQKGIVTYRRQVDELRIWEGSDFNVDSAVADYLAKQRSPLVELLSEIRPMEPLVAQRHSYLTGTLRYFERRYLDESTNLSKLSCLNEDADGLIADWLGEELPQRIPTMTTDGKPLIVLCASKLETLRIQAREFAALEHIQLHASELQTDGVARREVRYRLVQAEELLDESLSQAFDVSENRNLCWIQGKQETLTHVTDISARLSDLCDDVYLKTPILWNELINRRDLTSQGAKARMELIEAMLQKADQEKLGFEGYGPEVSMYHSLLGEPTIHRWEAQEEEWGFFPPPQYSDLWSIWEAIEEFCLEAKEQQQTLDLLYQRLQAPPYGMKQGAIPVLLAAVLLYHVDDVGVYQDGTFIPILGLEHFELLVRYPERFAVKYFEVVGLRSQVFKELEAIWGKRKPLNKSGVRNATLLTVVKPLFQFAKALPAYTTQTQRLSGEALRVLQALKREQEPDELVFTSLPQACGLAAITSEEGEDANIAKTLRIKLGEALREIQTAYDRLLNDCQTRLYEAFGIRSPETKLREDLRVRASYIGGQSLERRLTSFAQAAADESKSDRQWLEALVMIVADKPGESWTDEDATGFEIKLSDIARRFKNLEALQKEVAAKGEGFDARRITVTRPDGEETHRMVWVERESEGKIEALVEEILQNSILRDNPQLQQAFVAKLTERVLGATSLENIAQMQKTRHNRNNEQQTR
ncbi:hypothetical protein NG796_14565 [Laspinema sp. A4]|uniref:hypothetical protein n=1 Tax=Laspinema sp. D2d TaxID=2953686 RepID=UPI0021BB72DC|nr:hypothetical protein [Laspinema sp. D2d]MCT7984521.1 hypothetical protein [Laspinema sp. D2d]